RVFAFKLTAFAMKTKIKTLGAYALDTILPPRCVVSGDLVEGQGMLAPKIWAGLDFIASPFCVKCGEPFAFEVEGDLHCTACLDHPPPYETARAALAYNDSSRDLVLGFKHADQTHAVKAFVPWLKLAGADMLAEADALIPVPLHRWRLLKRRYNQAAIMATALSRETGLPVLYDALLRTRATPAQGHMDRDKRAKNVRKAFAVHPKYADAIKGKTLILIDDVYTTGSTVKECTKVLLKSGAARVHILTLARVTKFK
ncbi:MAG: ComF family protein, partial [Bdellovibrionales bacterium]